jgi:hypothetical protein
MKSIRITRSQDNLARQEWSFWYHDTYHALILTDYILENRPTHRHKFRTVEAWSTYRDSRRDWQGIKRLDDVPLPLDVSAEALNIFTSGLRVVKSFEEARAL